MYHLPSARKKKKPSERQVKLNLVPILDAVFIFIFFLLSSSSFIKLLEVSSDKPIVSNRQPKVKKKPLALTLKISNRSIQVYTGVPARLYTSIGKLGNGEFDLNKLHQTAYTLKKRNMHEDSIILEPIVDIPYEKLIEIIDSVRVLKAVDETLYEKNKEGIEVEIKHLFQKVVFGNLLSATFIPSLNNKV